MIDFPASPSVGQIFNSYQWDGEKWVAINPNAMLLTGNQIVTGGFSFTAFNAGTFTNGQTYTPAPANQNYQYATNSSTSGQNVNIAAPSVDCAIDVLWSNGAAVTGSVTFTGTWTVLSPTPIPTTANAKCIISIRRINGVSSYSMVQIA